MPNPLPSAPRPRVPSRTKEALPPLHELWEQARAPGADTAALDALLSGLSQPLEPGASARERADLLHRILEDKPLGEARGSDGRRVDGAAARALMAMGQPYALELSPEDLGALRAAVREARASIIFYDSEPAEESLPPVVLTAGQQWGRALSIGVGLIELLVVFVLGSGPAPLAGLLLVSLTAFMPAFLAVSAQGIHNRARHYTYLVLAALPSLLWMGATGFIFVLGGYKDPLDNPWLLLPLLMSVARLAMPFCLHAPPPDAEPE